MRYEFLEFVLDTEQQTLSSLTGTAPLRRQSFLVLAYLVEHAPAVVGKNELLDAIWGHQAISSSAVAQTIRELREALGDHVEHPRAIETRHRVGYRFIAEVRFASDAGAPEQQAQAAPPFAGGSARLPHRIRPGRRTIIAAVMVALAVALFFLVVAWQPSRSIDPSSSWPSDPRAKSLAETALLAARHFSINEALDGLEQARAI